MFWLCRLIPFQARDLVYYCFELPSGELLLAIWSDGIAIDNDPGVSSNISIEGYDPRSVNGIDILKGMEQDIVFDVRNDTLVIEGFHIKDYPTFLKLVETSR